LGGPCGTTKCASDQVCVVSGMSTFPTTNCESVGACAGDLTCGCLGGSSSSLLECFNNPNCAVDSSGNVRCGS
jgi:hypothetical protein